MSGKNEHSRCEEEEMEGVVEQLPETGSDMDTTDSGVSENDGANDKPGDTAKPEGTSKQNLTDKPGEPKSPRLTSIPGISNTPGAPAKKPEATSSPGKKGPNAKSESTGRTTGPGKAKEQDEPGRTGLRSRDDKKKLEEQARRAGKPDAKGAENPKQNGVNDKKKLEEQARRAGKPDTKGAGKPKQNGVNDKKKLEEQARRAGKPDTKGAENPKQNGVNDKKNLEEQARRAGKPDTRGAGKPKHNGVNGSNEVEPKKKKTNQYSAGAHGGQGTGGAYPGHGQHCPKGQGQYQGQDPGWYQDPQQRWPQDEQGRRDQMQEHIFRQAQASKQMVYGVFGNCVTMLEEMETRELRKDKKKALPRSDIYVPDQSKFDDKTIKTKLDTQLILLQAQLTSCHDAIRDEVKDELKANTLHWASEREEKNIPEGMTDDYVAKLFGLLDTGKADHPREFDEPPTIDEKGMHKALGAIMQGNQKRAELDKDFKDNPNKKAAGPNMRQTAGIDKGADRIVRVNPEHEHAVDSYRQSLR